MVIGYPTEGGETVYVASDADGQTRVFSNIADLNNALSSWIVDSMLFKVSEDMTCYDPELAESTDNFLEAMNDYETAGDGSVEECVALKTMLMFAQEAESISLRKL